MAHEPTVVRTPLIGLRAIHVMWLREMIRFVRAPSRVVGSLVMPLLFLGFLGAGLRGAAMGIPTDGDYMTFLAPGMMGMTLLMGSVFSGRARDRGPLGPGLYRRCFTNGIRFIGQNQLCSPATWARV